MEEGFKGKIADCEFVRRKAFKKHRYILYIKKKGRHGVAGASAIYSEGSEFKSRPQDRLY
jgi:hypothetical protein